VNLQSASDRIVRTLLVSIGIGSVLFTALGLPGIIGQYALLLPAYSVALVVVFCGLPPVTAVLALRAPVQVLRILATVHASAALLFLLAWIPAMTRADALAGGDVPWLLNTIAVGTSSAAVALPFVASWVFMAAVSVAAGVVRFLTFGSADPAQAVQDAVMLTLLAGFLMALIQLARVAGVRQDAAAVEALDAAATGAAGLARERQRARFDEDIRGQVLAALADGVENGDESRAQARRRALAVLHRLDRGTGSDDSELLMPEDAVDRALRTVAVGAGIPYSFSRAETDGALSVPVDVVDALVDATNEAMLNSLRHADRGRDRPIRRSVRAARTRRGVEVVIADDGRGFSLSRVGVDRLGLRLTILQRVRDLPGASAAVQSTPGRGTTVTLAWTEGGR